jgi:hypothetical protein
MIGHFLHGGKEELFAGRQRAGGDGWLGQGESRIFLKFALNRC